MFIENRDMTLSTRAENTLMKKFFQKIVLTLLLAGTVTLASAQAVIGTIGSAIGSGNVTAITRYFDNAVSMSISGNQSTYSRSQAEMVLRDFFEKHPPKGFNMDHSGGNNGNRYAIGTLTTATGSYRTYFSVKQKDGTQIIQEIRIEK